MRDLSLPPLGELLSRTRKGDVTARNAIYELMYDELRRAAHKLRRRESVSDTLATTCLVHEGVARLLEQEATQKAPNAAYLYAAAVRAMQQILVDYARRKRAAKRAGWRESPLDQCLEQIESQNGCRIEQLHDALANLERRHPRSYEVATYHFFGGLSLGAIGQLLGVSQSTVTRDWRMARAFLHRELKGQGFGTGA